MSFSCADSANFDAAAIQQLPNPLYYDPMFMHQLPIESAFHSIHPNDGMEDYVSAGHCQMELTSVAPARRANCASPDSAFASSSDVDSLWDSSSMMTTAADFEDDDDEVDLDVDSDDVLLDVEDGSVNWLDDFLSNRIESNGCSDKTELQATANDWTEEDISSSVVDESHAINTSNQSVCMVDVVAEDDGSRTPTKTAPQSSPTVRNLLKSVLRQKLQNRGEDVDTLSKVTPKKQVSLTPKDVQNRQQRQRQNREAARRMRRKRQEQLDSLMKEVAELERVNRDYVKLVTDLKSERSKLLNLMENHDLLASLDDHSSFSCPGDFNIDASTMTQLNTDVTIDRNDCTLESQIALDILWPVP